ncbi:hypothetical protein BJ994_003503 [Arthrobacter pigmenti]|uniref:Uncharacterized protein n=1 Tax=Arthrobacter pigmenti TaxID=271432 RepID=A0A846RW72_9MICC|nr:hypothetical protein [Arthrobacter pigmenti]NJC24427.1 hypothetical protein [Arthrobacter pigmenti]
MSSQILAQSVEQSDGSPAAIIISLVAAAAAVAAVVVARRALDYTKGEPLRAVQRKLNDELRERGTSLIEDIGALLTALRLGKNIPQESPALEECRSFLNNLATRRPQGSDASRHRSTAVHLQSLSIAWESTAHKQRRVDEDEAYLAQRRAAGDTDLTKRTTQLNQDTRGRDAAYLEVKGKAEKALEALEGEISVLDRLDRGEIQG